MELFNLLSGVEIAVYGQTFDIALNWIGKLIRLLISGIGSVGVGIILFSVILKLIVLPFDVYQRISMRKQNIKMKENQEKMEKLQKQYANDKEMYNKKLMEMYKESGISMFSSCLPMILSLVIFIVAINAFNAYAQYANVNNYNTMVKAYNKEIVSYCADIDGENTQITLSEDGKTVYVQDPAADKYIYYTVPYAENYDADSYKYVRNYAEKSYFIDESKALANADISKYVDEAVQKAKDNLAEGETLDEAVARKQAIADYFEEKGQTAVVKAYNTTVLGQMKFLWIKNIWATDASYKHPVLDYSSFKTEIEREEFDVKGKEVSLANLPTNAYKSDTYNAITGKLGAQKSQANGYYILILLSIGTILLQQFVSMRSQKEQQKYSSVDGQGASQQKIMMIVMTGMFAVFSFMYSAAFSIYMIMSNVLSLLSTLVINKLVDVSMSKKDEKAFRERYDRKATATRPVSPRGFKDKKEEKSDKADKKK